MVPKIYRDLSALVVDVQKCFDTRKESLAKLILLIFSCVKTFLRLVIDGSICLADSFEFTRYIIV